MISFRRKNKYVGEKYLMITIKCLRWQTGKILLCWKNYALCIRQVSLKKCITLQSVESATLPEKNEGANSTVYMVLKKK